MLVEYCDIEKWLRIPEWQVYALGKWKILTITNVPGERYINDEDCNCIINLPNDIQDHQVLKEGDILISLTGNVGGVSLW